MNRDGSTTPSTIRVDDTESADVWYPPVEINLEETSSDTKPLPPKRLKRYTTRQLRKRHTEPWLVFSLLAIVATLLAAIQLRVGGSSDADSDDCNTGSDDSKTEQLFSISLVALRGLSFAQSKFIDLLWDTAVGQGGRFIHGLVLHQLVSRALTLLLEYSALPYTFFLGVKFSTVSLESLWACVCILFSKTPVRTTVIAVGLFFIIGHVLAFATIWSAATGYEADRVPAYDILGSGSFVPKDSDRLTTCWSSQDLSRIEPSLGKPIIGPTFVQAYGSWGHIGDKKEFERLQMRTSRPLVNTSDAFRDIYAYAISKETFFRRYNATSLEQVAQTTESNTWFDDNCFNSGLETANSYNFTESCTSHLLYTSINGWQYAGSGEKEIESLPSDTRSKAFADHSLGISRDTQYVPYNTTFLLDPKVRTGERVVPYNSTLWWDNTRLALGAPFLEIGADCQWSDGSLGLCLCLDGNVISKDFRNSKHICLNDTGYRWGFSSFVVLIGIALETTWLLICTTMWFVIVTKSELVKMQRPGTGVIRGILDIAGAINSSIGADTGAYAEDELKKELEKCPPIGYELDDVNGAGHQRILLRPMPNGILARRHLRVKGDTEYG
ncbi:hypothetical protein GGR51DRAFT_533748 [Nemania sp. FL0031]|nr:hypothetical protein GGR51DRAFT_533748 [Nemania sp. FL0031]